MNYFAMFLLTNGMRLQRLLYAVRRFWWALNDNCEYCGGELKLWSIKKAHCIRCGRRND